jgi:hypothetical protein
MATIQTTQTGKAVKTEVRGRVFRYAPVAKSKERRRVCVLSSWAGAMLDRWGIDQPCHGPRCTHGHQTRDAVDVLVRDGVLKYIGVGRNVATYSYGRTWKGVPSGGPMGPKVMQLV